MHHFHRQIGNIHVTHVLLLKRAIDITWYMWFGVGIILRWNSIAWSDWWQSDSVSGNWTNESIGASSETWDVDSESIIDSITCSDSIEFDSVWQDWTKEAIVHFSTGSLISE